MRVLFVLGVCTSLFFVSSTYADSSSLNLSLPNAGSTYGQDSIRTADGLDCKNAIGGATQFEVGVTGIINNGDGSNSTEFSTSSETNYGKDIGVYARIVIPLDAPKERINCNSLYKLELRKKRLEVLKLQQELEALKKLNSKAKFEN